MGSFEDTQRYFYARKFEPCWIDKSNIKWFVFETNLLDNSTGLQMGNIYLYISGLPRYDSNSDDQEIALVTGLHPAVTYTFRVFAINSIDTSEPTDPVVAKTQEEGKQSHIL